jgi:hypothetical protein
MSRLSSLLVQDRIIDVGTMEQAFRRKDARGGRLGTILLEMGALDEATLQTYLSRTVDLPSPPPELLAHIDDPMLGVVEVHEALRHGVIPAALEGERLAVLVRDPLEGDALDTLESRVGHRLRQYILSDFRFEHALAELYGVRPTPRAEALILRYPMRIGRAGMSGGHAAVGGEDGEPSAPRPAILAELGRGWTTDQLGRFLAHCADRDDIVQALLGFSVDHFPRCAVLAVQHGRLHGFAGKGLKADDAALRQVEIADARVLREVRARAGESMLLGVPQDLGLGPLYDALHLDKPLEVACFVLRVGSRPAMLLVGDNESRPLPRTTLPAVELAVIQAAAALIRIVRDKKRQQEEPPAEEERTAPQPAVPAPAQPAPSDLVPGLAELDAGWDIFPEGMDLGAGEPTQPNPVVVLEGSESLASRAPGDSGLSDTDPASPRAKGIDSGPREAVASGTGADEEPAIPHGVPAPPLDDLMFGEIERLVLEEHPEESEVAEAGASGERASTIHGFAGISPEQIARAREARRAATGLPDVDPLPAPAEEAADEEMEGGEAPLSGEFGSAEELVEALLSGDAERAFQARAEFLLAGDEALDALAAHFPGPITAAGEPAEAPRPASACGPLLAVVAEIGQRFVPRLWELMGSDDRDVRFYATLLCDEVRHPESPTALADRLFDVDPAIRRLAASVVRHYRTSAQFPSVVQRLRRALMRDEPTQRIPAAEALAKLGDTEAVPFLVELVDAEPLELAETAQLALEELVFQSFGRDKKKWLKWYAKHGRDARVEWLLESITHKQEHVRRRVAKALARVPGLDVDFDPSAGKRDLKRIHAVLAERFRDRALAALV